MLKQKKKKWHGGQGRHVNVFHVGPIYVYADWRRWRARAVQEERGLHSTSNGHAWERPRDSVLFTSKVPHRRALIQVKRA